VLPRFYFLVVLGHLPRDVSLTRPHRYCVRVCVWYVTSWRLLAAVVIWFGCHLIRTQLRANIPVMDPKLAHAIRSHAKLVERKQAHKLLPDMSDTFIRDLRVIFNRLGHVPLVRVCVVGNTTKVSPLFFGVFAATTPATTTPWPMMSAASCLVPSTNWPTVWIPRCDC